MDGVNRRTAIALGMTAAAASVVPLRVEAATYGPEEGETIAEGVKRIAVSDRESMIPGYNMVRLFDFVFQPGAMLPVSEMPADMVCHTFEGTLQVSNNGQEFTAEQGQVWTCNKGGTEGVTNATGKPAIMRVAILAAGDAQMDQEQGSPDAGGTTGGDAGATDDGATGGGDAASGTSDGGG